MFTENNKVVGFLFCLLFLASPCWAYTIEHLKSGDTYQIQRANLVYVPILSDPRLVIVFCALHEDKDTFLNETRLLADRLAATKPFSTYMQAIDLYRIVLAPEEVDIIFKPVSGLPPLKVRRELLDRITAELKRPFKLIITDATGGTSIAELSTPKAMSLVILGRNRYRSAADFSKGFLHELGHALGLRDERPDNNGAISLPGPPNCAATLDDAKAWWGDLASPNGRVGYIEGCGGNIHFIRPTIASFMNDPEKAGDFGPVNERYLSRIFQ